MTKDEALKHHAEKYGVSLKQFKTMCNNASKHYENQGMNSVDYGLAREAYFAGFTDACKEALEQSAQEPDGWYMLPREEDIEGYFTVTKPTRQQKISHEPMALYYHPHQWQGLTDDDIGKSFHASISKEKYETGFSVGLFARAIEQALKEKNYVN